MSLQPVFTVIIPTYNREHFLKRTIDSILSQTFSDFELVIVDDGSTDCTKDLIDTYEDNRIVYFYKENGGQNSALNMGLRNAKGEYIAFCDSDDTWMPGKLEKFMQKYQEDNEIKVVYSRAGMIKKENGEQKIVACGGSIEGWCYKEVIEQWGLTSPSFLSCKRECFDTIGPLPENIVLLGQDDDMCIRLCKYFKVGFIDEILGIYHTDANDRLMSRRKDMSDDYVRAVNRWRDEVLEVGGVKLLAKKYYAAVCYYLEIDEIESARETYEHYVCPLENSSLEEIKDRILHELHIEGKIIIYGTGDWGKKIFRMLKMVGFSRFLFALTKTQDNDTLYGVPILELGGLNACVDNPLIVASSNYYHEMKTIAEERGFRNILSYAQVNNIVFEKDNMIQN